MILYRDGRSGTWATEVGIQVAAPFTELGEIVCSQTLPGEAYHALGSAHDAIAQWCDRGGHRRAGLRWEVYGDWTQDESKLRTDVFYLLEAGG